MSFMISKSNAPQKDIKLMVAPIYLQKLKKRTEFQDRMCII